MTEISFKPKIILIGAAGRMGKTIGSRFLNDGIVDYVGAIDASEVGTPVGKLVNSAIDGPIIRSSPGDFPENLEADMVLDFSTASAARNNLEPCLRRGWNYIIGATGFFEEDHMSMQLLAKKYSRRIVLVPNFTLGVNLMLRFVQDAARIYENVEIIELHHDKKVDAPSGTAYQTAHLIAEAGMSASPPNAEDKSRGKVIKNIPIHAVRLPGLLAHQEVLFGGEGEVLTIRHDTTDRNAFLGGIYLAIRKLPELNPGLTFGLDWAL